ncbi:hypothetical protein [Ferdinandcohnia sp. Marseille-Q9671]
MAKVRSLLLVIIVIFCTSIQTSASTYFQLEPEEVVNRAEIVVIGKYNFTSDPVQTEHIFRGYEFHVDKMIKGDVPSEIIAGIDMNDVPGAKEFQEDDGQFLLFLEKEELESFPIPVVAQNGMVKIQNGALVDEEFGKRSFYKKYLNEHAPEILEATATSIIYNSIGIAFSIIVLLFLYVKKKRSKHTKVVD